MLPPFFTLSPPPAPLARTLHEQAAEERAFFANTLRFSSKQVTEDMLPRAMFGLERNVIDYIGGFIDGIVRGVSGNGNDADNRTG